MGRSPYGSSGSPLSARPSTSVRGRQHGGSLHVAGRGGGREKEANSEQLLPRCKVRMLFQSQSRRKKLFQLRATIVDREFLTSRVELDRAAPMTDEDDAEICSRTDIGFHQSPACTIKHLNVAWGDDRTSARGLRCLEDRWNLERTEKLLSKYQIVSLKSCNAVSLHITPSS